jgi:AcrR family transcriptional regulator
VAVTDTSLRARKKEQTRRDLISAAVDLFHDRGFEATTVDEIVERANYSRPTFFRHFAAKEDVVFDGVSASLTKFDEILREGDGELPWERAERALALLVIELIDRDSQREPSTVSLWFQEEALRRRYLELIDDWEQALSAYLIEVWGDGASLEAEVVSSAIIGVGRAAVHTHYRTKQPVAELLAAGFDLLKLSVGDRGDGAEKRATGAKARSKAASRRATRRSSTPP